MVALLGASVAPIVAESESGSGSCSNDCNPISKNLWQPHAFSNYGLQEILIMKGLDIDASEGDWLHRFGFATEYMQNFSNNACNGLGAMPFWSGTNTMTIGNNDGKADLDAYQFGMGNVVVNENGVGGTITLSPNVQHVGTEFLLFGMQEKKECGLGIYYKIKAPLGAMMITSNTCHSALDVCPGGFTAGTYDCDPNSKQINGYFLPPMFYYPTLTAALQGGTYLNAPLYNYGQLACQKETVIRFGDLTLALGATFVAKENSLLAVGAKVSCPTGNVPTAAYILEPIFGKAGHWGVGAETFGHYSWDMDRRCGADKVNVWFQGEVMHLFNGRTGFRSFDLKANGKGSKYLLLQHFRYYFGQGEDPDFWSPDVVQPAINVTTLPVVSSFGVEGNFAVMVDYIRDNWNLSLGGEFWGRSAESLSVLCCAPKTFGGFLNDSIDFNLNNYAPIGRQVMNNAGTDVSTVYVEPLARINESLPQYSFVPRGGAGEVPTGLVNGLLPENRIPSDYNSALDICGAAADSIFTGKVLAELGYTWKEHCYVPNLSLFGGVEFAKSGSNWPRLWSVGLQGSLQF